jgi:hypothetical protein
VGAIFGRRLSSRMRIAEQSKGGGDVVLAGGVHDKERLMTS